MLEELFGNKVKVKLLKKFLLQGDQKYFCDAGLEKQIGENFQAIRKEIGSLEKLDLIEEIDFDDLNPEEQKVITDSRKKEKPKYYKVNGNFIFYQNLQDIFLRSRLLAEKYIAERIEYLGNLKLLVLGGYFVNDPKATVDMLIVGQVDKNKLNRLVNKISKEYDQELRFTHFSTQEFNYRNKITDKFLFDVMEGKKIVVVDRIERSIKMN